MRTSNGQPANLRRARPHEIALDETGEHVWHVTMSTDVEAVPVSLDQTSDRGSPLRGRRDPCGDHLPDGRLHGPGGRAGRPRGLAAAGRRSSARRGVPGSSDAQRGLGRRPDPDLPRRSGWGSPSTPQRGWWFRSIPDVGSLGIGEIAAEIARLAEAARVERADPRRHGGPDDRRHEHRQLRVRVRDPAPEPGARGDDRARGDRASGARDRRRSVQARPACTLSLTFDHRVLDGATVGRAFGALVELLESRERLDALPR